MPMLLEVGAELPPLTKMLDRAQLVKYAAGSGDFNPLHFDPEFPQAREIGDNIVHGRLKYAALGQLVSDWLGGAGFVRRITATYRGMDRRGESFTCRGRVAAVREEDCRRVVALELWTEDGAGRRTTEGAAEVVIAGRPRGSAQAASTSLSANSTGRPVARTSAATDSAS